MLRLWFHPCVSPMWVRWPSGHVNLKTVSSRRNLSYSACPAAECTHNLQTHKLVNMCAQPHIAPSALLSTSCAACRFGRKFLLIQGGIQMTVCQIITAVVLATKMDKATGTMPDAAGKTVLAFICLFVAGKHCRQLDASW